MTISSLDAARAHVAAALAKLIDNGDDSESVAYTLKQHGITGQRGNCKICPIAVFLCKQLSDDFTTIAVQRYGVSLIVDTDAGQRHLEMQLPGGITNFINMFDDRHTWHPELAVS